MRRGTVGEQGHPALALVASGLVAMTILFGLIAPEAGAATASGRTDAVSRHADAPRARAACPPCAAVAAVAIRTAVVKIAPKAVKAISKKVVKGSKRSKARIKSGAQRTYRWGKSMKGRSGYVMAETYRRLPRIAQGCGRGLMQYTRDVEDVSLLKAAINCGRGIFDILVRRQNPLGPMDQ